MTYAATRVFMLSCPRKPVTIWRKAWRKSSPHVHARHYEVQTAKDASAYHEARQLVAMLVGLDLRHQADTRRTNDFAHLKIADLEAMPDA
jgi:hypothetical protein